MINDNIRNFAILKHYLKLLEIAKNEKIIPRKDQLMFMFLFSLFISFLTSRDKGKVHDMRSAHNKLTVLHIVIAQWKSVK